MGKGISDSLYSGLYDALRAGKDTHAGVKDPVLAKARPFYEQGLIKNADDLKALVAAKYDPVLAGLKAPEKPAKLTFEQAYPDIDPTRLTADERDSLMKIHEDAVQAEQLEGAYQEAAVCLRLGGG
jgi:hypothetical protein